MPSTDVNNLTLPPYASTMERLHFITADPSSHWESFHTKRAATPQSEALTVIVETGLECDLACTYCYQSGYGSLRKIRRSSSERQAIFHSILDQWGESHPDARRLYLRFIGGEPLLRRQEITEWISVAKRIIDERGWAITTSVDTNGLNLSAIDVCLFNLISVTLSPRSDHDLLRASRSGAGSFSQITQNTERLGSTFISEETHLSVRYNVHRGNVDGVWETLAWLRGLGLQRFDLSLQPLLNWPGNPEVQPVDRGALKRLRLEVIRSNFDHGETLSFMPQPRFSPCSAYRGDSVKILSNGDLVSCDAQTHSSPQPAPGRLRSLIQLLPKSQSTRPCSDCIEFGLCGGEYFCKSGDVDGMLDPCDYLGVDLDDYLRFLVQAFLDAPDRVRLPMEQ